MIAETDAQGHQKARFIPVPAFQVEDAMDEMTRQFVEAWEASPIDKWPNEPPAYCTAAV